MNLTNSDKCEVLLDNLRKRNNLTFYDRYGDKSLILDNIDSDNSQLYLPLSDPDYYLNNQTLNNLNHKYLEYDTKYLKKYNKYLNKFGGSFDSLDSLGNLDGFCLDNLDDSNKNDNQNKYDKYLNKFDDFFKGLGGCCLNGFYLENLCNLNNSNILENKNDNEIEKFCYDRENRNNLVDYSEEKHDKFCVCLGFDENDDKIRFQIY